MERFEIRQQVKTVEKSWLETIHSSQSHRVLKMTYDNLVKNNPNEYFELVKVVHDEICLEFTAKMEG